MESWLVIALSCCTGLGLPLPPALPCSNPCSLSHHCPVISPVLPTHSVSSWVFISSSSQPVFCWLRTFLTSPKPHSHFPVLLLAAFPCAYPLMNPFGMWVPFPLHHSYCNLPQNLGLLWWLIHEEWDHVEGRRSFS